MAVRNYPGAAVNGARVAGAAQTGASIGTKVIYTVPAGTQAKLLSCSVYPTAGAATVEVRVVLGGNTVRLAGGTGVLVVTAPVSFVAGDQVRIEVTIVDPLSVFDGQISVEEYPIT